MAHFDPTSYLVPWLVWFGLAWLRAGSSETTGSVLRYSPRLKGMAVLAGGVPLGLLAMAAVRPKTGTMSPHAEWLLVGGFVLLSAILLGETLFRTIELRPDGVRSRSVWTGRVFLPWTEIVDVRIDDLMQWVVLVGRDGRKIRVHSLLSGRSTLADQLTRKSGVGAPEALDRLRTEPNF